MLWRGAIYTPISLHHSFNTPPSFAEVQRSWSGFLVFSSGWSVQVAHSNLDHASHAVPSRTSDSDLRERLSSVHLRPTSSSHKVHLRETIASLVLLVLHKKFTNYHWLVSFCLTFGEPPSAVPNRHGDPLSPLVFNLAVDVLDDICKKKIETGFIKGVVPHIFQEDGGCLHICDMRMTW